MKRPNDFLSTAAQVIKQKTDMDVVAVQVVQPDHVRIIFPDLTKKTGSGGPGAEAAGAKDSVGKRVKPIVPGVSNGHGGDVAIHRLPPIGDAAGVALPLQLFTGGQDDSAGAAEAGYGIDEEVFHASSLPRSSRKRRTYWAVHTSGV